MLVNNQRITEETKEEIKNTPREMQAETQQFKIYGMQQRKL